MPTSAAQVVQAMIDRGLSKLDAEDILIEYRHTAAVLCKASMTPNSIAQQIALIAAADTDNVPWMNLIPDNWQEVE